MPQELSVHPLPQLVSPEQLRGGIAVVIDVLRASTTIAHALAAGARKIVPCSDIDEVRRAASDLAARGEPAVLGGERDGRLITGFDLDNSPTRYTRQTVDGRSVVFTTTNGTRALLRAAQAERILCGAFVNLNAVIGLVHDDPRPVHLVCAGTDGRITAEDCLCAGAIAAGVQRAASDSLDHSNPDPATGSGPPIEVDDACRMAMDFFAVRGHNENLFLEAMRESSGGRNLRDRGFAADIDCAATWDQFELVPEFLPESGCIQAAADAQPNGKRWLAAPGENQ